MDLKKLGSILAAVVSLLTMLGLNGTPEQVIEKVFTAASAGFEAVNATDPEAKQILTVLGVAVTNLAPDAQLASLSAQENTDLQGVAAEIGKLLSDFAGVTPPPAA